MSIGSSTDALYVENSIEGAMLSQSVNMGEDNFLCKNCKHYGGACKCEMGIFIAFVNANMSGCVYYPHGHKCPHCGRYS